ncbi:MAG: hypothetical protein LLG14_21680 [Nocardiaceae bacterium]|nr:hypothetical protein [Nocardiaceae bacterium]
MPGFLLLTLVVAVLTIIDVAKAAEHEVRVLPKALWLLICSFRAADRVDWMVSCRAAGLGELEFRSSDTERVP